MIRKFTNEDLAILHFVQKKSFRAISELTGIKSHKTIGSRVKKFLEEKKIFDVPENKETMVLFYEKELERLIELREKYAGKNADTFLRFTDRIADFQERLAILNGITQNGTKLILKQNIHNHFGDISIVNRPTEEITRDISERLAGQWSKN